MSVTKSHSSEDTRHLRRSFKIAAGFVAILWLLKLIEILFDINLVQFGIYPRRLSDLAGILWAPVIHGSLMHLIANSGAIVILGTALLYGYPRSAKIFLPILYLGSGLGVWLVARDAYHIGASGLTFGMMFFVFTIGALRWDRRAIVLAMIVFLLYGSMIWGIFPGRPEVSFETHFFGAIIGVVTAFVLKNHDTPPPEKRYSWEDEDGNEESDLEQRDWWEGKGE